MVKIKNKTFGPLQLTLHGREHKKLVSTVLPGRGEIEVAEERLTPMVHEIVRRGQIRISNS